MIYGNLEDIATILDKEEIKYTFKNYVFGSSIKIINEEYFLEIYREDNNYSIDFTSYGEQSIELKVCGSIESSYKIIEILRFIIRKEKKKWKNTMKYSD